MDRSLLFESSFIFDNSNLVDRIRQSLIDLEIDPPTEEEVQNLLTEAISYLDKDLPINTAVDLFLLITSCFSHYPNQLLPVFSELLKTSTANAFHIIATSSVISTLTRVQPPLTLPDFHAFVDDSLKQILPQIQKTDNDKLVVFDHEIPNQCRLDLIIDLLLSAKLTKQLVSDFSPYIFSQNITQTNSNMHLLIKEISKNGLASSLPESVLTTNSFLLKLSLDDLSEVIPSLSENAFKSSFSGLEEMVIKNKNIPKNFSLAFLKKSTELNMIIKPIEKTLDPLSASDLTPQIWEYLKKLDFTLPDKIASEIKEFPDPILAFKIMPKRENLPQEVISRALLETDNIRTYEIAFQSGNINSPVLSTPEFWLHLLSVFSNSKQIYESFILTITQIFETNVPNDKLNEILDKIIFAHTPIQFKDCEFACLILFKLPNEKRQIFKSSDHIKSILERAAETKVLPSNQFWKLFVNEDSMYQVVKTNQHPIFLYGYSIVCRQLNRPPQLTTYDVPAQNDSSNTDLFEFISRQRRGIDSNLKPETQLPAIALIADAFLFTYSFALKRRVRNGTQQITIKGLTKDNILPFLAVICDCSNLFDRRIEILLEAIGFFKTPEWCEMISDSCKLLANNNSPILTTSIDHFLPSLTYLSIPPFYPFVLPIFSILIPILLRNEYNANQKILMRAIMNLSSGNLSIRNQIGLDGRRYQDNQDTPEEITRMFNEYGINLFDFLVKHASDIRESDKMESIRLNLKLFDQAKVSEIITNIVQNSTNDQEVIDTIHFIERNCSNVPELKIEKTENITRILHELIKNENWDEIILVFQFMKKYKLNDVIVKFFNEPIRHNIKVFLMKDIPIDQITIDDLISTLIADPQPETDRMLYDIMFKKMMQDQSIATDYITTLFEKINDRFAFTDNLLLTLYSKEYQTYGDTFIKALHRSYVMPPGTTTFILRPEFECLTLPISELGLSIISKLYAVVHENPSNFQAYVWLKSLASGFPFLFTANPQHIFDSILPAFSYMSLLFTLPETQVTKQNEKAQNDTQNNNNDIVDDDDDNNNNDNENVENGDNNNNDNDNAENNDNNNNNNDDNENNAEQTEEQNEQLKREKEQKKKEMEETTNKIKASISAMSFLVHALYSPKVLDEFAVWLFDNITTLDDSQILCLLLVLRSLYSTRTVQLVLTSLMIKNSFPEIVTNLVERELPEGMLKDNFLTNLYMLTSTYYGVLKSFTPEIVAAVDELQQIENPFQVTFDHCLSIMPNNQRNSPTSFLNLPSDSQAMSQYGIRDNRRSSLNCYSLVLNFINMIRSNDFSFDRERRRTEPTQNQLINFQAQFEKLAPPPKPYEGPLPKDVNREAFQLLPMKLQSTVLHLSLPKPPQVLTPKMVRYLATKPTWASLWIKKTYALLILPEHYGILNQIITDLFKIQQNGTLNEGEEPEEDLSPEDATLIQYCQGTLFENLIKQAANSSRSGHYVTALCKLFVEIAQNGTALISLLEYIVQSLNEVFKEEKEDSTGKSLKQLKRLIHVLREISTCDGFKENFNDICGNAILDIVCSSENRNHPTLLIQVSELFSILGEDMPSRITQLIGFMFLLKKPRIIPAALNLCSKLGEQKLENIMSLVQSTFDRAINLEKPIPNDIIEFLKRFPAVANARQIQLIQLLCQLLEKYSEATSEVQNRLPRDSLSKSTLELIGLIFNVLAPRRNQSLSIKMSDSVTVEPTSSSTVQLQRQKSASTRVPPYIRDMAPDFWDVFEKYHKMIMTIIQNDISRLKATFKFLLDYPELTDFTIRSSYFYQQMKKKISRQTLEFKVRRKNILADSYARLHNCETQELLRRFRVSFIGEQGVDAGGLTRDWFTTLVKELFNPNYALFIPSSNERSSQPNPLSYINNDHINYFKFAGKIVARALIEGINVDAHFTTSFSKHILHHPLSIRDLEDVDDQLYSSLQWMLENDVEPLDMYFTTDTDDLGVHRTISLKPNGINIKVTNENKKEFVDLMVEHRLKGSIINQVDAFCEGFNSLIPHEDIKRFTPNELDLLICGIPEIDVEDLKKYTEIQHPYTAETPVIKYFFDAISKWDNENLAKLFLFMTGSSQVPVNGCKTFKDMNQPITIAPGGGKERLPAAHTCFNRLDLPEYDSEEELNQKLMFAIQECNTFGFI